MIRIPEDIKAEQDYENAKAFLEEPRKCDMCGWIGNITHMDSTTIVVDDSTIIPITCEAPACPICLEHIGI